MTQTCFVFASKAIPRSPESLQGPNPLEFIHYLHQNHTDASGACFDEATA